MSHLFLIYFRIIFAYYILTNSITSRDALCYETQLRNLDLYLALALYMNPEVREINSIFPYALQGPSDIRARIRRDINGIGT